MSKWKYRGMLLVVFAGGTVLSVWPWSRTLQFLPWPIVSNLVNDILPKVGHALMIAPILVLLIDSAATRELLTSFAKDVSVHMVGWLLPEKLRTHIRGYLCGDFVRNRWTVTHTIRECPGKAGFVEVNTSSESEMQNISASRKKYPLTFKIAESAIPQVGTSRIVYIRVSKNGNVVYECSGDALKKKVARIDGAHVFFEEIAIESRSDSSQSIYDCWAESVEYLPDNFSNPFMTYMPVIETKVKVAYPKQDFDVNIRLTLDNQKDIEKVELQTGAEWIIRAPLLPGQGFYTHWKRKTLTGVGPAPAAHPEAADQHEAFKTDSAPVTSESARPVMASLGDPPA